MIFSSRQKREALSVTPHWLPGHVVGRSPQIIDFAVNYEENRHQVNILFLSFFLSFFKKLKMAVNYEENVHQVVFLSKNIRILDISLIFGFYGFFYCQIIN